MEKRNTNSTIYNFENSTVQIGDGNTQNIVNAFESLANEIEKSNSTPEEKIEVKSLMQGLINHPIISSVLGGSVSGLLGLLK